MVSPRQGPASLPAELVNSAQREVPAAKFCIVSLFSQLTSQVRRLQELRRYIQEECDQLLLRKERLREEVSSSLHHPHATKQASHHHGKGHRVAAEEVMVRTVATQAPSSLLSVTHGPSLALSSLAHAYKVDGGSSTYFQTGVPSKEQFTEAVKNGVFKHNS